MSTPRTIEIQRQAPDGEWIVVGEIFLPEAGRLGGFTYDEDYNGPPLCPSLDYRSSGKRTFVHRPTVGPVVSGPHHDDLHPIFAKALPGPWGELVMNSHSPTYTKASPAEKLWMLGDWQSGGLRFHSDGGADYMVFFESQKALQGLQREIDRFIARYANEKICPYPLGQEKYRWALSANGGSQPKAAYLDDDGAQHVVKFPREILGTYQEARVEQSLLEVSRIAGLRTVESELISNADKSSILLTRRFDIHTDARNNESQSHCIPGSVALGVKSIETVDYLDLARFLREHGAEPEADIEELFGRMLLNRAVNNTDDHIDQWVFEQDVHTGRFRLTPNFDVLVTDLEPDGAETPHSMAMMGDKSPALSAAWIQRAGQAFGIEETRASAIAIRVLEAVQQFPDIARANGVTPSVVMTELEPAMRLAAAQRAVDHLRDQQQAAEQRVRSSGMEM